MSSPVFPQLSTGAMAQFPIRKSSSVHTVTNVLEDGTVLAYADPNSSCLRWDLSYAALNAAEVAALQSLFNNCSGRQTSFTFIDPTGNMFGFSMDLTAAAWQTQGLITLQAGASDPFGGLAAFNLTNTGQMPLDFVQTINAPAAFKYCCSAYVQSASATLATLVRESALETVQDPIEVGTTWTRIASSSQLTQDADSFVAGVRLLPGQQLTMFGLQLEPQLVPSRYRATAAQGGVYPSAHWSSDQIAFVETAPGVFSTSASVEVYF
jgi:hypothetical protein